jgi:hypothetical protein
LRTLIIIAAVIVIYLILRQFMRSSPAQVANFIRQFGLVLVIGVLLVLLATGRLNWVFAALAAAAISLKRLLPLLRYVPLFRGVYQHFQTQKANQAGPAGGQSSSVTARYVRMTLDHDSGAMDGEVLSGQHKGARLSQLSLSQLLDLMQAWQDDNESVALLQAYLERVYPDWQTQAGAGNDNYSSANSSPSSGQMTRAEACQILGVAEDAVKEDIISAHRRLMQKLHPDRGGSTYLAAKINQAKDVLLDGG